MIKKLVLLVFAVLALYTCSESDDYNSGSSSDNFDRQLMLTNWADNIIIPALEDLSSDLSVLVTDKDAFVALPDDSSLSQLRLSWLDIVDCVLRPRTKAENSISFCLDYRFTLA